MFVRLAKDSIVVPHNFILVVFNEAFLSMIMAIFLFCFKEISSSMIKSPFAVPDPPPTLQL